MDLPELWHHWNGDFNGILKDLGDFFGVVFLSNAAITLSDFLLLLTRAMTDISKKFKSLISTTLQILSDGYGYPTEN